MAAFEGPVVVWSDWNLRSGECYLPHAGEHPLWSVVAVVGFAGVLRSDVLVGLAAVLFDL